MFTTGQFSKVAQVSKRLLQYYDEIGLFTPAHKGGPGGARGYTAEQLPELFQILALKDLGISLDEIRRMLHDGLAGHEIHEILVVQRARIRGRLEQEELRLRAVESRLRSFESAEDTLSDLIVKPVPATPALTYAGLFPTMQDALVFLEELALEVPRLLGAAAGPLVGMNHCDGFEMEDLEGEIGVILKRPFPDEVQLSSGRILRPATLPAWGSMVSSVRRMDVEDTHRSFAAIGLWMERTGHRMAGPSREIFLEPPGPDRVAMVETQFPVEPIG